MTISKNIVSISLFLFSFQSYARMTIIGDKNADAGKSFSFYVSQSVGSGSYMYVGRSSSTDTDSDDSIRKYSLSGYIPGSSLFVPLAPAKVILNGVADQANPLIGQKISALGMYNENPLVVCNDTPSDLYWVGGGLMGSNPYIYSLSNLKDAQGVTHSAGSTTAGIIKVIGSKNFIFAATKKSGSTFGVAGSGIALITLHKNGLTQQPAVVSDTGVKSVPFDGTLSDLVIESSATMDGDVFDMFFDEDLQRLYIVTKMTGGTNNTDGVVGIMMGYLQNQTVTVDNQSVIYTKLKLVPFVSKALCNADTSIIAGVGANTVVNLHKVRVMHTTTGCSYLIVVGNASGENSQLSIYALPLIDKRFTVANSTAWSLDETHGALASKEVEEGTNLATFYNTIGSLNVIRGRGFQQAPTTSDHLTLETDAAAKIGGGVTIGEIQDIVVYKDAVFVSVAASDSETSGVFHSQPIFDATGAIKGWTSWKRVISASDTDTVYTGISYDPSQGRIFALKGSSATTIDTALFTTWSNGLSDGLLGGTTTNQTVGFNTIISTAFADVGGVQGLFDFPKDTLGFSTTSGSQLSLMIATGYKKIMIIKTGADNGDNVFIPQVGSFIGEDNKNFTQGALDESLSADTTIITMSGGDLDLLGSITSALIVKTDTVGNYMIVGGAGGLAVLRQFNRNGSTRRGWSGGLTNEFSPLTTSFRWELIGNYTNIKKLTYDYAAQSLYVLTPTKLERIPVAQLFSLADAVTSYTIATPASLGLSTYASFSDVIVSGDFALLGTSQGIYTTGAEGVVSTATTTIDPLWKNVELSEGPLSVIQFFPFSNTNFTYDIAKNCGGMVDVLAGSVSKNLASLYRFSIADAADGVTATTLQPISDHILSTVTGPYAHIGAYKNYYINDGALPLFASNQYTQKTGTLIALPANLTFGIAMLGQIARDIRKIPCDSITTLSSNGFVKNSALGSTIFIAPYVFQILE